jgi:uncharacterized protein (TIGR02246 family)
MPPTRRRLVSLIVGCCTLALFVATAAAETPPKEAVVDLFNKWNAAIQSGKTDEVLRLYAKDAILLPTVSNKVRHNHAEIKDYFDHFVEAKPVGKINEQNIRTFDDLAINSGTYTFTLTKDGKRVEVPARFTFVYQKQGKDWLIIEHHSSAMPEPKK